MVALRRFQFEKLGRDKVPDIMRARGIIVYDRILSDEEYLQQLKRKIEEEALEVIQAKSRSELIEECADLMEVIGALANAAEISLDEIEHKRIEKREQVGAFDKKLYIAHVDVAQNNPSIERYTSQPDKYPEIDRE